MPEPGSTSQPASATSSEISAGADAPADLATQEDPSSRRASVEKLSAPASIGKRSQLRHANDAAATPNVSVVSEGTPGIILPKLLHSVRPVPPPEAVRDFVTGNVKVDALIDPTGNVKSISVLSGPASLRSAAIEAVKQYKYAPATRNSTPISAHVTLTVQFWYEP